MRHGGLPEERFRDARILVVDDQEANVRLLVGILERSGYQRVTATTDPDEALRLAARERPDLVLLDLRMPGRDGFEVLEALRETIPDERYLPVLVLTADSEPESRRAALAHGAEDFLTKPFDAHEVLLRCRNLLETRLLYQDLSAHNRRLSELVTVRSMELARAREAHETVIASLMRLEAAASPEQTAEALAEELVQRAGFDLVGILAYGAEDVVVPLSMCGRLAVPGVAGRPLSRAHGRYLKERAAEGAWLQRGEPRPDGDWYVEAFARGGISATLHAPLAGDAGLIGVLVVGSGRELSPEEFTHRLPTVIDYAAIARALLAPALAARREEHESRDAIRRVIDERDFWPVFQPVVDLDDGSILGYEALTRFADGTPPDVRFAQADALGIGVALEESCLQAAVKASARLPTASWLSVNVSPQLVLDADRLGAIVRQPERPVVLEITEHVRVDEYATLRASLDRVRTPTRVAIDDAGAGFASFRHIVELRPEYVKLDLALVRSIETDPMRQALVTGLRYFAAKTGCTLIAEGIETEPERAALRELGVRLGQGYLLGRPGAPEARAA